MILIDMGAIEKKENTALEIYNTKPGTKAIEVRRRMMQLPEVAKALNPVEKYVFAASTKTPIAEIDDAKLVENLSLLFKRIAMDVGYIIPQNENDWNYIQSRLLDILKRYHSDMTLADIKIAFELATTGELDEFLPKDKHGNPDKNHYQQFNADYLSKILNAYRRKQNGVIHKAYKALPELKKELTPEEKRYYHNQTVARCREVFLQYKYTGRFVLGITDGMLIYDWLRKLGFANEVAGTEDDRKQAFARYMQRVARGFVNKYEAYHVQRKGTDAPELDFTAYEIARDKEIARTFDRMIADELQIDNYLDFWK